MKHIFQKILLAFFSGLILPQFVFAADVFFEAKTKEVRVSEPFEVKLLVNTPEESVNAFEGKIIFPSDFIEIKEIRDGNSIINFWIDPVRNCVSNGVEKPDSICFSGITPGGFQGNNGLLFSAVFEAKSEGIVNFEINDAKVLRNDGAGSQAVLTIAPLEMKISSEAPVKTPAVEKIKDIEPPESFVPEISRNESIANDKWFVVFATQDKASGIDHYEVKESRQRILSVLGKWIVAESPYILADQELRSYVFVKAVDKVGNVRIENISPQNPLPWYENYENWFIIILGLAIAYAIKKFLWRKYLRK